MILTEVLLYNPALQIWMEFEGVVDTGASYCVIAEFKILQW